LTTGKNSQKLLSGELLLYGIVLLLVYLVYEIFAPFLAALAWAGVLVVVSYPAYERLARSWGPSTAALACTIGVTLVLIVPALVIGFVFAHQGMEAAQSLQLQVAAGHFAWVNRLWTQLQAHFPQLSPAELSASLRSYGQQAAQFLAGRLGAIVRHTAEFLLDLTVTILAMYYLFRDGHAIMERLRQLLPFEAAQRDRLLAHARELIFACVTSSFVAGAAHGALGGLALAVAGVPAPIFWGVMMGFFSLVPFFGSALIWVPASIGLMLEGHIVRGILFAAFCAIIVGMVDNVVRPWFISGRSEMNGLLVFIGLLGGLSVFGLLGVVLGPIVVAMAATLLDLYQPPPPAGNTSPPPGAKDTGAVLE
jgi:predicted PurR-regulated permease PerM